LAFTSNKKHDIFKKASRNKQYFTFYRYRILAATEVEKSTISLAGVRGSPKSDTVIAQGAATFNNGDRLLFNTSVDIIVNSGENYTLMLLMVTR